MQVRRILRQAGSDIQIISKIENAEGLENIDEILAVSDGVMVARGDMGVEIPFDKLPPIQKMMIKKANSQGKIVITATQMLDSMMKNPRPTRAEVSDVANAVYDGTGAVMLSGETAAGLFPPKKISTIRTGCGKRPPRRYPASPAPFPMPPAPRPPACIALPSFRCPNRDAPPG